MPPLNLLAQSTVLVDRVAQLGQSFVLAVRLAQLGRRRLQVLEDAPVNEGGDQ